MNKPGLGRGLGELMDRTKASPAPPNPATSSAPATATSDKAAPSPAPTIGVKILLRGHLRPTTTPVSNATTAVPPPATAKLALETRLVLFAADILLCLLSAWIVLSAEAPLTWYAWTLVLSAIICGATLGCLAFKPDSADDK